jgi:16S rRNA C967 or C1407 C5-methylase (RsmB/RsmF family)
MRLSYREYHLFQLLKRFENQPLPLDFFLSCYFKSHPALGSKDRQFIAQTLFGMCRWKGLLDYLVGNHPSWEKRYALFCALEPEKYSGTNKLPNHIKISFPEELYKLLEKNYGEEKALSLCSISNTEAPTTIRINPLKTTRESLLTSWEKKYPLSPCQFSSLGIQFKKRIPLVSLPEFKNGLFEIQDEASQLVADLVKLIPGEHVLDFCAGAGGKTLAFAHRSQNKGQLYLHDVRPAILAQARKRLCRAGIQNAQFLPTGHSSLQKLKKRMDWVLIDAPCSGTGTLRRNPDQKWKFTQTLLSRLQTQQREIFAEGLSYLKKGGKILYATCSILKEENDNQVAYFISHHGLELVDTPFISFPTPDGMDGFFAAVLQKRT